MIHIINYYSHPLWLFIFLTIRERTTVIESDELAQKNRVSTMGVGAVVMVTLNNYKLDGLNTGNSLLAIIWKVTLD